MKQIRIDGTSVVCPKDMTQKEVKAYVRHIAKQNPKRTLLTLNIKVDGEFIDLQSVFKALPFERIRRITGYLTGDTSTWNNAKKAELAERVKHTTKEV